MDRIPSKYGVLIVQKWKHFVALSYHQIIVDCDNFVLCRTLKQSDGRIFNAKEILSKHKRLTSLNLSGTFQGKPRTRPPSCTTPQEMTTYNKGHWMPPN